MDDPPNFGTPGANWNADRTSWRGNRAFDSISATRRYEELVQLRIAHKEAETVLLQYGKSTGASAEDIETATTITMSAFNSAIKEVFEDNLLREIAPMVGVVADRLKRYHVTLESCPDSPFGGCLYEEPPKFGDQCVFCHRYHR